MTRFTVTRLGVVDIVAERHHRYNTSPKGRSRQQRFKGGIRRGLLDKPLCAVDGEGVTRPDGSHHYTALCATWPGGQRKLTGDSLTSKQCLDFLLDLPEEHTVVGYGLSYDTNMWLRGLPHREIDRLLDKGYTFWGGYELRWIERKRLSIKHNGRSVVIYDVLANWQTTFLKALLSWHIGDPLVLELVRVMKEERGNFASLSPELIATHGCASAADLIEKYCFLECDLLRDLCRALFDAILKTPYRPSAVYGPGALAGAALSKEGVRRYMTELPEEIDLITRHAYFGGRFDCSALGWFPNVTQYDIKSAYPDQIRFLPCLKCGQWRRTNGPEVTPWGMFCVEFDVPDRTPWTPFPHRQPNGNVYYPYKGQGWYHGAEVLAAIEMFGRKRIRVRWGWAYETSCSHQPFDFVDALFQQRKAMEYGQGIVIKLILNSLYGKLAQQVGEQKGKKPPFQCFYWAGAITAGTRAKLLRALHAAGTLTKSPVIGIATDSLVSLRKLDLPIGGELGEWELKELNEYAQISNGIYHAVDIDGGSVERSRGFERNTLDWADVRRVFVESQGVGTYQFTPKGRFVTLREARSSPDHPRTDVQRRLMECRWVGPGTPTPVEPHTIKFWPNRKFPGNWHRKPLPHRDLEGLAPDDYRGVYESQPIRTKETWSEVLALRARYNPYDWQVYA